MASSGPYTVSSSSEFFTKDFWLKRMKVPKEAKPVWKVVIAVTQYMVMSENAYTSRLAKLKEIQKLVKTAVRSPDIKVNDMGPQWSENLLFLAHHAEREHKNILKAQKLAQKEGGKEGLVKASIELHCKRWNKQPMSAIAELKFQKSGVAPVVLKKHFTGGYLGFKDVMVPAGGGVFIRLTDTLNGTNDKSTGSGKNPLTKAGKLDIDVVQQPETYKRMARSLDDFAKGGKIGGKVELDFEVVDIDVGTDYDYNSREVLEEAVEWVARVPSNTLDVRIKGK